MERMDQPEIEIIDAVPHDDYRQHSPRRDRSEAVSPRRPSQRVDVSALAKIKTKTKIGARFSASSRAKSRGDSLPVEGSNTHNTSNSIGLKSMAKTGLWLTKYGSLPRRMSSRKR
jgi:hypothetical protein